MSPKTTHSRSNQSESVDKTGKPLVVVGTKFDDTPSDRRRVGAALQSWQSEFPGARHIWGLADLLDGRTPRTPAHYFMIPIPANRTEARYEPVALVLVADDVNIKTATANLHEHLSDVHNLLSWFETPETYSFFQR